MFFTALAIALFFAMIYLRIALDRTAFELDAIEDQIVLEESRQLDLRLEIARLQDPLRVSTEARRIGLTHPEERIPIEVSGVRDLAIPVATDTPVRALDDDRP
jgi:cell division protein FtsL